MTSLIYRYWGKAKPASEDAAPFHLLPFHCLDVAAVAAVWWDSSGNISRQFKALVSGSIDPIRLRAWVLFFVTLHDLGKFDIRFQLKSRDSYQVLQPGADDNDLPYRGEIERYAHGESGLEWFVREYPQLLGLEARSEDVLDIWQPWLAAVAGHHGKVPRNRDRAIPPDAESWVLERDSEARREWFLALEALFLQPVGLSLKDTPPLLDMDATAHLAGFCSVCDWLGSNETWFSYAVEEASDLAQYLQSRMEIIQRENVLTLCGLVRSSAAYGGVQALLSPTEAPRQLQTLVDGLLVHAGLTLIEAPTGSGKTETALAYAWRLLDEGIADSIIFALPTQATANAMWDRLNRFADTLFGAGSNLVLAHGKAKWHEGHAELKAAAVQKSVQADEDIRVQCAQWLAESRKRVFLGQIGVCTVDQVLLSVLPLRHKFVRGFGVMKSILIVDEVHAYDNYMYGLQDGVLRQQRRAGGSAILLSATLPKEQRCRLANAWGAEALPTTDAPYPLLTQVNGQAITFTKIDDPAQQPAVRKVGLECVAVDELLPDRNLLGRIIEAARLGARVAIICNLVNDAQALSRALREMTETPVDLFHARFRFRDRQQRESEVLTQYGRHAERNSGRILVATQVVEQSLDLDFDWLITQICPVDLLFQRIGRLHRHDRSNRPSQFDQPLCTVLVPPGTDYGLHKVIYGNTRVLWRTQKLLQACVEIEFPAAYRAWIEKVYERKDWPDEPENIACEYEAFRAEENATFNRAQIIANDDMNPFADNDETVSAFTRDGEMSISLVLVDKQGCLLGESVPVSAVGEWERREQLALNVVGVPASWRKKKQLPEQDDEGLVWLEMRRDENSDWVGQWDASRYRYSSDYGLEKEDA